MENVLKSVLPRLTSEQSRHTWKMHPYMGKKNLLKALPKLLLGYSSWITDIYGENYRIVIVVDQDYDDCVALKQQILNWASEAGLIDKVTVRIVVVMLEAWFLGDASALEAAFPKLRPRRIGSKADYRNPDDRKRPSQDLDNELKASGYEMGYQKLAHSTQISPHLNLEEGQNRSHSFQVLLTAFRDLLSG